MKFSTFVLSAAAIAVSVSSRPLARRDVNPDLVPQFGVQPGVNPDGTGNCDGILGANGKPILIPCQCPPPRDQFIDLLNQNVNAGFVINNPSVGISFPEDDSKASALARLNAATVTLQNIHGPGVGCPQAATTFGAQAQAINNGQDPASVVSQGVPQPSGAAAPASAPAATTSAAAAPAASPAASGGVDPSLVPDFGVVAGTDPDGTGNCKGINNINIPCSCPPPRDEFIASLNANVAAGEAVNNPSVKLSFPSGNSKADQQARINALLVTLQNIHGPGVGCPAVSTVYGQLQQQINALPN
ncbi:hypothetical protein PYCCODRAFT_1439817 [Trametes coccinea BRFM310]|uniref:Uncharacterized protein n=1 Tax=Trametes coccinea (strain BRFM310) TaxID=1353009 RepID=A0A1Y2I9L8_TRAC3|nr:hypothetical protein PYCCODRAFT_1439817 [Trametes coccinea BRFM310]